MYAWQRTGSHKRKGTRKQRTGTVVFHAQPADKLKTSFDDYVTQGVRRRNSSWLPDADDADTTKGQMTSETAMALRGCGFEGLLPCQAQTYSGLYCGRDAILISHTGTGKTLAYLLPLVERWVVHHSPTAPRRGPFMVVLVYSLELACQVRDVMESVYGQKKKRVAVAVAGMDNLKGPIDVLIGTIASVDLAVRGVESHVVSKKRHRGADEETVEPQVDASDVTAVVIDEVDVTLGPKLSLVAHKLRKLLHAMSTGDEAAPRRQFVLVGATVPNWCTRASFLGAKKYVYQLVGVDGARLPESLTHIAVRAPSGDRGAAVTLALRRVQPLAAAARTILFGPRSLLDALRTRLTGEEGGGAEVSALMDSDDEATRIAALSAFNHAPLRERRFLLCGDVAARGLDFVAVDAVVNVVPPPRADSYVHRAGRAGRLGRPGVVVTLFHTPQEETMIRAIETQCHASFQMCVLDSEKSPAASTVRLRLTVKSAFMGAESTRPTPSAVVKEAMPSDAQRRELIRAWTDVNETVAEFECPVNQLHVVRKLLWNYNLKEVK